MLPPLTLRAWLRHDLIWEHLADLPAGSSVLEIGTGEGAMGARLARRFDYVGVERDPRSADVASGRVTAVASGEVLVGDVDEVGEARRFDAVCAFEVLEHMEDDVDALKRWRSRLSPGGRIVLSVPAHRRRFGPSDTRVGHYRRYDPDDIEEVLRRAGFTEPLVRLYGFPLGYALEAAHNTLARRRQGDGSAMSHRTAASGRFLQPGRLAGLGTYLVSLPFRGLRRLTSGTGMGTGIVASARTP